MSSDENGRRDPQHLFVGSSTLIARRSLQKSVSFVLFNLTVFVRRLSRASLAASAVAGAHIVFDVVDVVVAFTLAGVAVVAASLLLFLLMLWLLLLQMFSVLHFVSMVVVAGRDDF